MHLTRCGAVAQLGEHKAGSLGVRGSIPLSSTKINDRADRKVGPFVLVGGGANPREFEGKDFPHVLGEPARGLVPS